MTDANLSSVSLFQALEAKIRAGRHELSLDMSPELKSLTEERIEFLFCSLNLENFLLINRLTINNSKRIIISIDHQYFYQN